MDPSFLCLILNAVHFFFINLNVVFLKRIMHQSHYLSIFTFVRLTLFISVSNLNDRDLFNRYKQCRVNRSLPPVI